MCFCLRPTYLKSCSWPLYHQTNHFIKNVPPYDFQPSNVQFSTGTHSLLTSNTAMASTSVPQGARTVQTHYEILEISPAASQQEIKDAYKRLAFLKHPDKNLGDIARACAAFQQVYILPDPSFLSLDIPICMSANLLTVARIASNSIRNPRRTYPPRKIRCQDPAGKKSSTT